MLGVDLKGLGARKRDPSKVRLAACLKATTDVSNGWLATRLEMGTPASLGQAVRRNQDRNVIAPPWGPALLQGEM